MKFLALDTATETASCAVMNDNILLGDISISCNKHHSVVLLPMIDNLLKQLNIKINEIDGFVVSRGPGSFTGLRIGAACVKGLSQGTGKPFVSVSSLDSLAYNMAYSSGIICPVIDALRDNVYTALYNFNNHKLNRISDYMMLSLPELSDVLMQKNEPVNFIGDGSIKYIEKLSQFPLDVNFALPALNMVRAASSCDLGKELLIEGKSDDLFTFTPLYLRKSSAERELDKKEAIKEND